MDSGRMNSALLGRAFASHATNRASGSRELTSLFLLRISREVCITEGGEEAVEQN